MQNKYLSYTLIPLLCAISTSCGKSPPPAAEPKAPVERQAVDQQPPKTQELAKDKEKKSRLVRTRDLISFRNYFRNLGIAYVTFEVEHGKPPTKKEDLHPYLRGETKLLEMLDNGDIVFYYGVNKQQMLQGASNTILAHEAYEDFNGRRLVVMGDGTVQDLNVAEFDKAPKAKK